MNISATQTFILAYLATFFVWMTGAVLGPIWILLPSSFLVWVGVEMLVYMVSSPVTKQTRPWMMDFTFLSAGREIRVAVAVQ